MCVEQTVSCRLTSLERYERTRKSARNRSFVRCVTGKKLVHNALTFGVRQELVLKSEKSSCWHFEFHTNSASRRSHRDEFAFSYAHALHNRAYAVGGYVDEKLFHRFTLHSVNRLENDLGGAYAKLVTLSAHSLDEDGKVHFTSTAHFESVRAFRLINAQGYVFEKFLEKSVAQMTRRHEFALFARKRTVVDTEVHLDSRFTDFDERHRLDFGRRANGVADGDILYTAETHDVAHHCVFDGDSLQSFDLEEVDDFALIR